MNIEGGVKLAKLVRKDLVTSLTGSLLSPVTSLGAPLLTSAPPTPQTTIAGHTFTWAQGIIMNYAYAKGTDLITKYQKIYDGCDHRDGVIIGDA